jgi:hypothetical protein
MHLLIPDQLICIQELEDPQSFLLLMDVLISMASLNLDFEFWEAMSLLGYRPRLVHRCTYVERQN